MKTYCAVFSSKDSEHKYIKIGDRNHTVPNNITFGVYKVVVTSGNIKLFPTDSSTYIFSNSYIFKANLSTNYSVKIVDNQISLFFMGRKYIFKDISEFEKFKLPKSFILIKKLSVRWIKKKFETSLKKEASL